MMCTFLQLFSYKFASALVNHHIAQSNTDEGFVHKETNSPSITNFPSQTKVMQWSMEKNVLDMSVSNETKSPINNNFLITIVTIIGMTISLTFAISYFWIRRLRREIDVRKRTERLLVKANERAMEANRKLQLANKELRKISMVDDLTGIFNRRYFDSFLENVWGINTQDKFPIALIMLDIDHFKRYNDTYGHLAGDKCLQRVAKLIDEMLTERSDFEARYGGEEFVILLANSSEQTAATVAEKIREKIASTSIHNGVTQSNITISLGVSAMVSKIKVSPEILISAADEALYKAK